MVKETRIIFSVKDILAFRVHCKKCQNEVTMRLNNGWLLPDECPLCRQDRWLVGSSASRLLQALRGVFAEDEKDVLATVLLEVDGTES